MYRCPVELLLQKTAGSRLKLHLNDSYLPHLYTTVEAKTCLSSYLKARRTCSDSFELSLIDLSQWSLRGIEIESSQEYQLCLELETAVSCRRIQQSIILLV